MSRIGFIGVGNMGAPMAQNLIRSGHTLKVFDLSERVVSRCSVWRSSSSIRL